LSVFLFLIAEEGFNSLMRKAVEYSSFNCFRVNNDIQFEMLQFADDTIIVGEGSWANLWCIKYILRSFELVSGLRVNFHKSKVYGIHASQIFLQAALTFLSCNVGLLPFKFLGLPIGDNPRRSSTWKLVIENLKKWSSLWKNRHLSVGGRITLLNATLSSIPLYSLSFFISPKFTQEIVKIQRNFL